MRASFYLGLAYWLFACSGGQSKPPVVAPEPASEEPSLQERMKDHFGNLRGVELAMVFGQEYDTRFRALLLVELEVPSDWEAQEPWVERIRDGARRIAEAPSDPRALAELTGMAASCAGCHQETGAAIPIPDKPAPLDLGNLESRMKRHKWATDRLWEGLVVPSDKHWQVGINMLSAVPMPSRQLPDPADQAQGAKLGKQLAQLAEAGRTASRENRPSVYADLLAVCAGCHSVTVPKKD